MPATGQIIRVNEICEGSVGAIEEAWRAVAELEAKFEGLLAALDGDSGVNLTTYAATYTAGRRIVD